MKILHVNHCLSMGGAEVMLLDLAYEQQKLGHHVTICSMHGAGVLDEEARQLNLRLIHLNSSSSMAAQFGAIRNLFKSEDFDIVHMHWGVWLPVAMASRLSRIPCIYTNHSNHSRRTFLLHRLAAKLTTKIVVLTSNPENYMQFWVGVPMSKVEVIPNGVDVLKFSNANPTKIDGIPEDAAVVGMVARMAPPKDYRTFIHSAKLVQNKFPHVHFVAIGDGPERRQNEDLVKLTGVSAFHFLGTRSDVYSLLRRMKINVLSTRDEGFGITLIESMASGCAVVASDIPPVRFVLDNGKCGRLVPPGDVAALAQSIITLLEDDSLRTRLVSAGKERVKEFSSQRMTERYINLYAKLVA